MKIFISKYNSSPITSQASSSPHRSGLRHRIAWHGMAFAAQTLAIAIAIAIATAIATAIAHHHRTRHRRRQRLPEFLTQVNAPSPPYPQVSGNNTGPNNTVKHEQTV